MKIIVARFSALGDVAIAVKVIYAIAQQNPDIEIIILTKPHFQQLFAGIDRVSFINVDLKNKHKGIFGLRKLAKELPRDISVFIDLHNVLRTKILRFFTPSSIKKFIIDKGKKQKKALIRSKKLHQLKNTAERYAETFSKSEIYIDINNFKFKLPYTKSKKLDDYLKQFNGESIVIAPFAAHKSKMYPLDKMEVIINQLHKKFNIFILGGGNQEKNIAETWSKKYANVHSIIGKFSMTDEILLIDSCKAIITMDSGNMHLASLTNTYIISIWGGTHPFLGFAPFNYTKIKYIQKQLDCRPCSVFGTSKCKRKDFECLNISPENIINIIEKL